MSMSNLGMGGIVCERSVRRQTDLIFAERSDPGVGAGENEERFC
jgi:hypothetical protein